MLYLGLVKNKEDFILEDEENFPYFIKNILYFFRKITGQLIQFDIDGKKIILISKFNKKTIRKIDKIFRTDVTKNICICEQLAENQKFLEYIKEKNLNIMNGKWLFKFLICDIAEYICQKLYLIPEKQEISLLIDEPSILAFETIKRLSSKFRNINIVTNKLRKFDKIEKELQEESGMILNVTNNFKSSCLKSKIIFNFDFDEKNVNKIRFLPDSVIVNLENNIEIKQSNFKGRNVDFYSVNLPQKYKKIYRKLNDFNSSILYESFIYKRTSNQNIWNEIKKDNIDIIILENKNKVVNFAN